MEKPVLHLTWYRMRELGRSIASPTMAIKWRILKRELWACNRQSTNVGWTATLWYASTCVQGWKETKRRPQTMHYVESIGS